MKKAIFFLLLPALIWANETYRLEDAINLGLKNNELIKSQVHIINSKKLTLESAKSDNYPSLVAEYTFTQMDDKKELSMATLGGTMKVTQVEKNYNNLNIGLQYNLFTGGAVSAFIDISRRNFDISKVDLAELTNEMKYNIQNAYISILELYAIKDLYKAEIEALKAHAKDVELLYNQGLAAKIDILHTSVKVKDVEKKILEIDNNIKIAKFNLKMLMGEDPNDNFDIVEIDKDFLNIKLNDEKILEEAYKNRPILQKLSLELQNLKKSIDLEKSSYLPKAFIYGGYNYNDSNDAVEPKGGLLFQAGLKYKLDWDKPFKNISSKKEEIYAFESRIRDTKLKLKVSVQKSIEDFNTAKKTYDVALEQLKEAEEYYRVTNLKYKSGLSSNTDLLDAESILTSAKISQKKAYYDMVRSFYKIELQAGTEVK
jgi:outer membrane protein TolC